MLDNRMVAERHRPEMPTVEPMVDGAPINYSTLPENHRETVRRYMEHGIDPGYGWRTILSKDLAAVCYVDAETFQQLPTIYRWLHNRAPHQAWGSVENVRNWMRRMA